MTEYHSTYKKGEGESTQWQDIQRKLGNYEKPEPVWKPEPFTPAQDVAKDRQWIDGQSEQALEAAEDEFGDDHFLEEYRQKRIQELQRVAKQTKFGTVTHITKDQFIEEVTRASDTSWVIVLLYKDKVADCALLLHCLEKLAEACTATKFVKIISDECIPGYPDHNLPTLLLYKDGQVRQHLCGLISFGGRRATAPGVGLILNAFGDVCIPGGAVPAASKNED